MNGKMKRLSVIIALTLACSLIVACGSKKQEQEQVVAETPVQESTEVVEETTEAVEETVTETEETVVETETETETETVKEAVSSGLTLSDDVYSYQVEVDGQVLQFPMWYSDFVALGWDYDGDEESTLNPNQYTLSEIFKNANGATAYVQIANMGQNVLAYKDCLVIGFNVEGYYLDKVGSSFTLPGGLKYGEATAEDIEAAYGPASDRYESEYSIRLTYEEDIYNSVELVVDVESGTLDKVDIQNIVEIEGGSDTSAEVSDEVPAVVGLYEAPAALGDDLLSGNVEIAGDVYTMPAPVSEFLANGWEIVTSDSDETVAAMNMGWVSIRKDNQKMRTMVRNYSDKATTIENCFVTCTKTSHLQANLETNLPGGIYLGMPQADFEKALANYAYEKEVSGDFTYYSVESEDDSNEVEIDFVVNKEGIMYNIEVENSPREYTK